MADGLGDAHFAVGKRATEIEEIDHAVRSGDRGRRLHLPGKLWIIMERAMGIEPTSEAWEASILPLNYARPLSTLLIIHD